LYIIQSLLDAGATISAYDPEAMNNVKELIGDTIQYAVNPYVALSNADALIIATEWSEFRTPDFDQISSLLKNKIIFDGRNLFTIPEIKALGFEYYSVGRN
jgi:UDPglucose 6-dehydrogenase